MPSYFGIGDKARGANKIYLGVDGVAREVKKMYLGVDGKARLVYPNNTWKKYTTNEVLTYYWEKWKLAYNFTKESKSVSRIKIYFNTMYNMYTSGPSINTNTAETDAWFSFTSGPTGPVAGSQVQTSRYVEEYSLSENTTVVWYLSVKGSGYTQYREYSGTEYTISKTAKKGSTSYGEVSSTIQSKYPTNGQSGSYWYVYDRNETSYSQGSYIEDVYSADPNAYPVNGKHTDGYWYIKQ